MVQRVPVRIYFDSDDKYVRKLKAGMSAYTTIDTRHRRSLAALLGLQSRKRVGETAAAIELRQSGENSILNTISLSVSASLTQVFRWVYWWNSTEPIPDAIGSDLVLASLNTDFNFAGMSYQEISALVSAWQAGAISQDTMFDLFRAGEVISWPHE